MIKDKRVWFVTGISSGIGQALAHAIIEEGDFLIGTFRSQTQTDEFNRLYQNRAIGITLDITHHTEIENAVDFVKGEFGRVDVLVNNAGYGLAGAIEETSITEAREIFETNFFSTLKVTQAFLPLFRHQKRGHIIQISSHGGFKAFPGFGLYNASKFALEGFSEALAAEVAPLGIKLTLVEPGPFRTNFAGTSFRQAEKIIADYNETAGTFREKIKQIDGKQEGDPIKGAKAIIQIVNSENPPTRLPLGKIALVTLASKIKSVHDDIVLTRALAEYSVYS